MARKFKHGDNVEHKVYGLGQVQHYCGGNPVVMFWKDHKDITASGNLKDVSEGDLLETTPQNTGRKE